MKSMILNTLEDLDHQQSDTNRAGGWESDRNRSTGSKNVQGAEKQKERMRLCHCRGISYLQPYMSLLSQSAWVFKSNESILFLFAREAHIVWKERAYDLETVTWMEMQSRGGEGRSSEEQALVLIPGPGEHR